MITMFQKCNTILQKCYLDYEGFLKYERILVWKD